jgi:hypothetical protein
MPDYVDVLPLLRAACASLPHNALIQSEHLSLFEATSAVEIGEPRMDVGARLPGSSSHDEERFDAHTALMPDEVLWVMDTVLGCEVRAPLFPHRHSQAQAQAQDKSRARGPA